MIPQSKKNDTAGSKNDKAGNKKSAILQLACAKILKYHFGLG